ncbi:Hypothetical predicted protein [Cloeon dipterum]|nr:Hypothetical predicted protein [Cloeon dipterum]
MTLVSFETLDEFRIVTEYLHESRYDLLWIWTGGRQTVQGWEWDSGEPFYANQSAWGEFQPNEQMSCINFSGSYSAWDDDDCASYNLAYMCEEIHYVQTTTTTEETTVTTENSGTTENSTRLPQRPQDPSTTRSIGISIRRRIN